MQQPLLGSATVIRRNVPADIASAALGLACTGEQRHGWSGFPLQGAGGLPGTAGFLAVTRQTQEHVLVTAHHVLFGAQSVGDPASYLLYPAGVRIPGRALFGRRGVVRYGGAPVYVDCAVACFDERVLVPLGRRVVDDDCAATMPAAGAPVTMHGAVSGVAQGVVLEAAFCDSASVGGRTEQAPGQILVGSLCRGRPFAVPGDSGAALRDPNGVLLGLLRGVRADGCAVFCPIAPVLWVLNLRALRFTGAALAEVRS